MNNIKNILSKVKSQKWNKKAKQINTIVNATDIWIGMMVQTGYVKNRTLPKTTQHYMVYIETCTFHK